MPHSRIYTCKLLHTQCALSLLQIGKLLRSVPHHVTYEPCLLQLYIFSFFLFHFFFFSFFQEHSASWRNKTRNPNKNVTEISVTMAQKPRQQLQVLVLLLTGAHAFLSGSSYRGGNSWDLCGQGSRSIRVAQGDGRKGPCLMQGGGWGQAVGLCRYKLGRIVPLCNPRQIYSIRAVGEGGAGTEESNADDERQSVGEVEAGWERVRVRGEGVVNGDGDGKKANSRAKELATYNTKGSGVQSYNRTAVKIVKEMGSYNGSALRIQDSGRGAYIRYGNLNFALPVTWKDRSSGMNVSSCYICVFILHAYGNLNVAMPLANKNKNTLQAFPANLSSPF